MELFTYLVVVSLIFNVLLILAVVLQECNKSILQNQIDSLIRTVNKMSPAHHSYRRKEAVRRSINRHKDAPIE